MRQVTVRSTVDATPERVFDLLLDNRNDPRWCPMVTEVELVEGEPGVGAVYRYLQGQGPGRPAVPAWMRTTVAERPRRLAWDNAGRGMPYHAAIELTPHGSGTRVTHTNRVVLPTLVQQALWWTIATIVLRVQQHGLRRELDR